MRIEAGNGAYSDQRMYFHSAWDAYYWVFVLDEPFHWSSAKMYYKPKKKAPNRHPSTFKESSKLTVECVDSESNPTSFPTSSPTTSSPTWSPTVWDGCNDYPNWKDKLLDNCYFYEQYTECGGTRVWQFDDSFEDYASDDGIQLGRVLFLRRWSSRWKNDVANDEIADDTSSDGTLRLL